METIGRVHVALLTGLTAAQAAAARHTLVSERRPLALLDAAMVPDVLLVLTAAQRALYAQAQGTMKARTLHMELLYQLSPRTNIAEALSAFGMGDTCSAVLFVQLDGDASEAAAQCKALLDVPPQPIALLPTFFDEARFRTFFRLPAEQVAAADLVNLAISSAAVKGL